MNKAVSTSDWIDQFATERLVRYSELRPCTTAFIDTRTPGSEAKENFTIIGPGVAENPDQYVHIDIPHGFNIGGARQPPGCVNSQHSHETAEVFVVHSGKWAFLLGPNKDDGEVILTPGDVISIPIHVFRGFENIGDDSGFLFAILGGDDPGHVTWAPYVFETAREHGLVLMEDGSLIDTTKNEPIPQDKRPMNPTTEKDVAALRRLTADDMTECVVPHGALVGTDSPDANIETPIIGAANGAENLQAGRMNWPHGFNLRHIVRAPGTSSKRHVRREEEVIFVHRGILTVELPGGILEIAAGDTLSIPVGMTRRFSNNGTDNVETYIVRGGDSPGAAEVAA